MEKNGQIIVNSPIRPVSGEKVGFEILAVNAIVEGRYDTCQLYDPEDWITVR